MDLQFRVLQTCLMLLLLFGQTSVIAESFSEKLLSNAVSAMRQGDLEQASKALDQLLVLEPNNPEAHFRIGEILLKQNKIKPGWEKLKKAVELAPQNIRYAMNLSLFYERQNNLEQAMRELQRVIDSGTQDKRLEQAEKRLSLLTGRSLGQKGEMNAALLIFNGLLLEYPNDPEVLYNIGLAYIFLNRVQEAEATFKKLVEVQPDNAIALTQLASIYERSGRLQLALLPLTRVLQLNQQGEVADTAKYRHGVISTRILLSQRQFDNAIIILNQLIQMQPNNTEAYFMLGVALASTGKREQAEQYLLKVLQMTPEDFSARLNLASLYLDWGKHEQAREHLLYVIENDKAGRYANQAKKRLDRLHSMIAEKALKSGNLEESLKQYEKALAFNAGNISASFNRGVIFAQQNRFEEAAIEFESAVRYDPKNLSARYNLAIMYTRMQRFLDAAEQYEAIIQINPNSNEGRRSAQVWKMTKARGLWLNKQLTDAEILLTEITQEQPNEFSAFVLLGIIQASKTKLREAAKSFQTALDLNQGAQNIRLQLARVYEGLGLDELAAQEYRLIIFNGAEPAVLEESELRLRAVEARLSGFFRSFTYNLRYDDNVNQNPIEPTTELFSEMAFNIIYGLKFKDDMSFRIITSPTYMNMHYASADFLRMDINSSLTIGPPDENWTILYGSQNQAILISETKTASNQQINISRSRRMLLPALFGLAPDGFDDGKVPTSFENLFVGQYVDSFTGAQVKTASGGAGVRIGQGLRGGVSFDFSGLISAFRSVKNVVQMGVTYAPDANGVRREVPFTAYDSHDYEYNSYSLTLNLNKMLAAGVSGNISTKLDFRDYINFDSGAEIDKDINVRRRTLIASVTTGLNYNFYRDVRFNLMGNWTRSVSSLPVGFLTDAETSVASFQSTALGNYDKFTVSAGMVMNF